MRILYVSQYFPPEMGAPAARVSEISREWVRLGHDVTVLTGFPNHPTGVVPPAYRGKWFLRERIDGINVVRVPIFATPNKGFARRVLMHLSFNISAAIWGLFVTGRPDLLIATSPQFFTGLAGAWLAWLKRVPFVFEVRDLWPASIVEVGAMKSGTPIMRFLEWLEVALYRRSDLIIVVAESFVGSIAAKGIPREKIAVITNGVDLDLFRPGDRGSARRSLGLSEGFLATYVGTHGMAHGLGLVLDAAKLVADERVHFLLVGEGAEKARLKARAVAEGIGNVTFLDQQPRDRVAEIYAASDLCLVLLRNVDLFKGVIPSKIFEFMGAGRPILTTVDGESRAIVEHAGAGQFSPPEDAAALAAAIRAMAAAPARLTEMGAAGRAFVEANYSRPLLAEHYAARLGAMLEAAAR
jgi:glycosyltransferase involved in cell wall biosynthesis